MKRYVYVGPPEQRGPIPGHAFPEGVLPEDAVAELVARGLLADADSPAAAPEPDPAPPEPAPAPKKPRKA